MQRHVGCVAEGLKMWLCEETCGMCDSRTKKMWLCEETCGMCDSRTKKMWLHAETCGSMLKKCGCVQRHVVQGLKNVVACRDMWDVWLKV